MVDFRRFRRLQSVAETFEPDLIHSHDIGSIRESTIVANRLDCPLVIDLHELYPESLVAHRLGYSFSEKLKSYCLLNTKWRYERFEGKALRAADAVLCESTVAKEHYLDSWDVNMDKIFVVQNTPDITNFESINESHFDLQGEFVVTYAGNFTGQRDLKTAIEAMDVVRQEIPEAHLLLIGDGPDAYVNELKKLVNRKGLESNVTFTGWIDFTDVLEYFSASDVSLCTTVDKNQDSNAAIANKLFQSMAVGTPVIVNHGKAMRDIVETTESGVSIPSGDPTVLSRTLINLHKDPDELARLGSNGRDAVWEKYNFETDYQILLNGYAYAQD